MVLDFAKEAIQNAETHSIDFSDFTRRPTKSFGRAWLSLLGYGYVQSIGFRGYYRITSSLVRDAERIKKDQRVSDEDYAYLRNLGEKVRLVDD